MKTKKVTTTKRFSRVSIPVELINKARKQLAKVVHPDINPTTTEEMQKINSRLEKIQNIQENTAHIQFVVDTSGSMSHNRTKLITSYNKLLERQARHPGKSTFGYKTFHEEILPQTLINPKYLESIITRGNTPLYDTIGNTIQNIDNRLDNPTNVVFIILTDGNDNGPDRLNYQNHYNMSELRELVQKKFELGWQFIYCSEDRDIHGAKKIGIPDYAITNFGDYHQIMGKINKMLLLYRQGDIKLLTFKG